MILEPDVPVEHSPLDGIPRAELPAFTGAAATPPSRRGFIQGSAIAVVASAGAYTLLNVFPRTRQAAANNPNPPYNEYPRHNPYGRPRTSTCAEPDAGCTGSSPDYMDNFFCATCDEYRNDPSHNWFNYAFNGYRGNGTAYSDRLANKCTSTQYDLWVHDSNPCGYCTSELTARCHDGQKWSPSTGQVTTICHSVHSCNGRLTGQTC